MDRRSGEYWDRWWQGRLPKGSTEAVEAGEEAFPLFEMSVGDSLLPTVSDDWLIAVMAEYGLRTILCAGNGVSQEPRGLADAGFHVTALDISPIAVSLAEAHRCDPTALDLFRSPETRRPGGSVEFVVGDLLDTGVCPGPFDVVIERRTVQVFDEQQRASALSALAKRLSSTGVFLSICLDDPFPHEWGWAQHVSGRFHASESWFREEGWAIWDGVPSSPLKGQVAWLVRFGSMKRPPPGADIERLSRWEETIIAASQHLPCWKAD